MNGLTEPEQISVCRAMCERRDLPIFTISKALH